MADFHDTLPPTTIVSGLPRSGTSLTMAMLGAGGMKLITDELRPPDADNPCGYFEDERVKKLDRDSAWLWELGDAAIKVISFQLSKLPAEFHYNLLYVMRPLDEILASQETMLRRKGHLGDTNNEALLGLYERHVSQILDWMAHNRTLRHRVVQYHDIIDAPHRAAREITDFLAHDLDTDAMAGVVDPKLYRQRVAPTSH